MNAYILVGGRSRRMGASKAELFLERILAATRPAFDEVLAVHRADGEPLPVRTIVEAQHPEEGAIFGIARALEDARGKCFVIAVDYPLISADLLQHLASRFEASAAPALVPVWDGHPQPLCAGWDASVLPLIQQRITEGRHDLKSLIAAAGAEMIAESELRALFPGEPLMNVNTPDELQEAKRLYGE